PVTGLRNDIGLVNLRPRCAQRAIEQISRGLILKSHVRRRRADIEGGLTGFGERGGCGRLKCRRWPGGKGRRATPIPVRRPPTWLSRRERGTQRLDDRAAAVGSGSLALARQTLFK